MPAINPVKIVRYGLSGWVPGGRRLCVFCGHKVWRFMPYRQGSRGIALLMRALDCIGSDVDHFECPRCGAHDRERHLLLYLGASGLLDRIAGKAIVHFAPEKRLSRRIHDARPARYVRCDLHPPSPDVERVDIEAMPFASDSIDIVIANHVLEHVGDVDKALAEIRRVLKPGGHAILQTPYSAMLERTWCDSGITTDAARLQAYGQEDHVRLFGRDVFGLVESHGMESRVASHAELLPQCDPAVHGVNPREPFFLFQRTA